MDPRYSDFNITTALALLITIWMVVVRIRGSPENNWGMVYYLAIVIYSYIYPGYLAPRWIYAGVISALFLRFEFMGGGFLKLVRFVEFVILGFFLYTFATTLRI